MLILGKIMFGNNEAGRTPLHFAAQHGHTDVVEVLLKAKGININAVDDGYGDTPLHFAALYVYTPEIRFVLENRANVNTQDKDGNTLLHLAALHGGACSTSSIRKRS